MFLFYFSLEDFNNTITDSCHDKLDIRHEYSLTMMIYFLFMGVVFFLLHRLYTEESSCLDYSRPEFVKPPWVFGSFNKLDKICYFILFSKMVETAEFCSL